MMRGETMPDEGPLLELLLHRLAECPPEFWETCDTGASKLARGTAQLCAILCDHFRAIQPEFECEPFKNSLTVHSSNHAAVLAVIAWLLHDPWFLARHDLIEPMQRLFCDSKLGRLASLVKADQFVQDADRREELARICLNALSLLPAGESAAQAADRLTTLDSDERERVLKATLAAEKRARQVREAMAKAKAQESSSRYGE
jgi:hypothetical protein